MIYSDFNAATNRLYCVFQRHPSSTSLSEEPYGSILRNRCRLAILGHLEVSPMLITSVSFIRGSIIWYWFHVYLRILSLCDRQSNIIAILVYVGWILIVFHRMIKHYETQPLFTIYWTQAQKIEFWIDYSLYSQTDREVFGTTLWEKKQQVTAKGQGDTHFVRALFTRYPGKHSLAVVLYIHVVYSSPHQQSSMGSVCMYEWYSVS